MGNHSDTGELLEMIHDAVTSVKSGKNPDILVDDAGQPVDLITPDTGKTLANPKSAKDIKGNVVIFDNPPAEKRPKNQLRGIRAPRDQS